MKMIEQQPQPQSQPQPPQHLLSNVEINNNVKDHCILSSSNHMIHLSNEDSLNDWIELSDENVRLKKLYDKLRCDYNELEIRFETLHSDKASLNHLFQQQMVQICDMKKIVSNSIDINEYDRLKVELERSDYELKTLTMKNKLLNKQLEQKDVDLQKLMPVIEELNQQNDLLRDQFAAVSENQDITAKLLCDIDLLQDKLNEYRNTIDELNDENQELKTIIEQYQIEHNANQLNPIRSTSSTTLTSHCTLFDVLQPNSSTNITNAIIHTNPVMPVSLLASRQNSMNERPTVISNNTDGKFFANSNGVNGSSAKLEFLRCSYSNLNILPRNDLISMPKLSTEAMETMAEVKIKDLEQRIIELNEELIQLRQENDQLKKINNFELVEQQTDVNKTINNIKSDNLIDIEVESNNSNRLSIPELMIDDDIKQSMMVVPETNDQSVQTEPILLTSDTRKIVRCPLEHHIKGEHRIMVTNVNMKQSSTISKRKKKKRRFLCLF